MTLSLGIMQPYFLPYIGYWQLMGSVDKFIVYDDVNYIKGGWVNRNRIAINGRPSYFTVPLVGSSPNKRISELEICEKTPWREKIKKSLANTYSRSPSFNEVMPIFTEIIDCKAINLSDYLFEQLTLMRDALELDVKLERTSVSNIGGAFLGVERVLSICQLERAKIYVNLPGGRALYSDSEFQRRGIELRFLKSHLQPYRQFQSETFLPNLSVVDVLFSRGLKSTREALSECSLVR